MSEAVPWLLERLPLGPTWTSKKKEPSHWGPQVSEFLNLFFLLELLPHSQ